MSQREYLQTAKTSQMFHLLRKRRSKRANKKSQGSRVAKVSPVGSMEGESSPKDPAYLATGALRICTTCRTRHRRREVVSFKHCLFVSLRDYENHLTTRALSSRRASAAPIKSSRRNTSE